MILERKLCSKGQKRFTLFDPAEISPDASSKAIIERLQHHEKSSKKSNVLDQLSLFVITV
jgi:hypothetical protein